MRFLLPAACFAVATVAFFLFVVAEMPIVAESLWYLQEVMAIAPVVLAWGVLWTLTGLWVGSRFGSVIVAASSLAWAAILLRDMGSLFEAVVIIAFGTGAAIIGRSAESRLREQERQPAGHIPSGVAYGSCLTLAAAVIGNWIVLYWGGRDVQHSTDYTFVVGPWLALFQIPFLASVWLLGYISPKVAAAGYAGHRRIWLLFALLPAIAVPISRTVMADLGHEACRFRTRVLPSFLYYLGKNIAPIVSNGQTPSIIWNRFQLAPPVVRIDEMDNGEHGIGTTPSGKVRTEVRRLRMPANWSQASGLSQVAWLWFDYNAAFGFDLQKHPPYIGSPASESRRNYILDSIHASTRLRSAHWQLRSLHEWNDGPLWNYSTGGGSYDNNKYAWRTEITVGGQEVYVYVISGGSVYVRLIRSPTVDNPWSAAWNLSYRTAPHGNAA
jgi:hypothetical protein